MSGTVTHIYHTWIRGFCLHNNQPVMNQPLASICNSNRVAGDGLVGETLHRIEDQPPGKKLSCMCMIMYVHLQK